MLITFLMKIRDAKKEISYVNNSYNTNTTITQYKKKTFYTAAYDKQMEALSHAILYINN